MSWGFRPALPLTGGSDPEGGGYVRGVYVRQSQLQYVDVNVLYCSKDVRLPIQLQRAMAAEAEAAREARAKVCLLFVL